MKRISKINTDSGFANRPKTSDAFFFSDDIEKWMHSSEGNARQRKHEEKKRTGGRIDKNSWG